MPQTPLILNKIIDTAIKANASYIHLETGTKPSVRIAGKLAILEGDFVIDNDFLKEVSAIVLSEDKQLELAKSKSTVVIYVFEGQKRFRINIFYQKNNLAMIFNYIPNTIKPPSEIGVTKQFMSLLTRPKGLIVIAGTHGAGKTGAAASLLNHINQTEPKYIVTLEHPIEYIIQPDKSIIEQREIGRDANDFVSAANFVEGSDADVVFLSEIRDYDALLSVFDLITGGRLVLVIIEANTAAEALEHLANLAPASEIIKVRDILSNILLGVLIQQLVPRRGGGQITVTEILIATPAVSSLIKEGRYGQVVSVMQTSRDQGMRTLDQYLIELVRTNEVNYQDALTAAIDKANFQTATHKS